MAEKLTKTALKNELMAHRSKVMNRDKSITNNKIVFLSGKKYALTEVDAEQVNDEFRYRVTDNKATVCGDLNDLFGWKDLEIKDFKKEV